MQTQNKNRLSRVRAAIYGQPWAITPEWLEAICEIFERHVASDKLEFEFESKSQIAGGNAARLDSGEYQIENGVAIIPLMGPIFPRANMMTRMSGASSIQDFSSMFADAINNPDVNAVLLQIDSPGGSVLGVNEAASQVFAARNQGKPIVALAEGMAASAAYLVGSQADEFYATEGAIVGSIGVVMRIDSDERQKLNEGIDPVIIKTGKFKAVGNGPVTDEQKAHLQETVNDYFSKFQMAVSRARPMANMDEVSTGEVWVGAKAQGKGLIDGISTMQEQMNRLAQ
jgi:capsid assembly protease